MSHADFLRDNAREWDISECPQRAERARAEADHITHVEAERDDARQDLHHHKKYLESAETRIAGLEAEVHRLRHFAWVVEEHAENLGNEAAIALHPTIVVDEPDEGAT